MPCRLVNLYLFWWLPNYEEHQVEENVYEEAFPNLRSTSDVINDDQIKGWYRGSYKKDLARHTCARFSLENTFWKDNVSLDLKQGRKLWTGFKSALWLGCQLIPTEASDFSPPQRPDRLWGSPILVSHVYRTIPFRGIKRPEREVERSPVASAEVTSEWICTSSPPYLPSRRGQGHLNPIPVLGMAQGQVLWPQYHTLDFLSGGELFV